MAGWSDYISLLITVLVIAGVIYIASFFNKQLREAKQWSQERLQRKGVNVSRSGMSVKRKTHLANREEYFDATQRGIVKALTNAYYGPSSSSDTMHEAQPQLNGSGAKTSRSPSGRSVRDDSSEEKRKFLGLRGRKDS